MLLSFVRVCFSKINVINFLSPPSELRDQRYQIEYSLGLSSLTIVRYLLESFPSLPLNVQSRLLKTHDILLMLIPLIEEPPWIRLTSSSWEVYEEGKWTVPEDLNVVGKSTAQVWLCVFYLTGTKECRESYPLNDFRKGEREEKEKGSRGRNTF